MVETPEGVKNSLSMLVISITEEFFTLGSANEKRTGSAFIRYLERLKFTDSEFMIDQDKYVQRNIRQVGGQH